MDKRQFTRAALCAALVAFVLAAQKTSVASNRRKFVSPAPIAGDSEAEKLQLADKRIASSPAPGRFTPEKISSIGDKIFRGNQPATPDGTAVLNDIVRSYLEEIESLMELTSEQQEALFPLIREMCLKGENPDKKLWRPGGAGHKLLGPQRAVELYGNILQIRENARRDWVETHTAALSRRLDLNDEQQQEASKAVSAVYSLKEESGGKYLSKLIEVLNNGGWAYANFADVTQIKIDLQLNSAELITTQLADILDAQQMERLTLLEQEELERIEQELKSESERRAEPSEKKNKSNESLSDEVFLWSQRLKLPESQLSQIEDVIKDVNQQLENIRREYMTDAKFDEYDRLYGKDSIKAIQAPAVLVYRARSQLLRDRMRSILSDVEYNRFLESQAQDPTLQAAETYFAGAQSTGS